MLTVSSFITVTPHIPGKYADIVVIVGQAVFALRHQNQVLRDLFISIGWFIQNEERHNALTFGILGNIHRNIYIKQATQNPAHALLSITDEPPVFQNGSLARFCTLLFGSRVRFGLFLILVFGLRFGCNRSRGIAIHGLALENLNFLVFIELIEMLGFPSRDGMQVQLGPGDCYGLGWSTFELFRQTLQLVKSLLVGKITFLDPTLFPAG